MGSEQSSFQPEKSHKNETRKIYNDRFSNHSETMLANEHELVSDASTASSTFVTSTKHVEDRDTVEGTMYQPSNIQLDSAKSPLAPPSTIIASSHVQSESLFTFKAGSNLQYDATAQTNEIAIQDTTAFFECVWDVSNEESSSHLCENVPHKDSVLLKSGHFSPQKSPSEPYESESFSSSVVGTQMTQLSPTAPSSPLPLKSAFFISKPVTPNVPFSSSVEINSASKPLHLNSTCATFQPCHGVFSSSIATQLSQFTDVPPMPSTAENMCSSKQGVALNLLQESSNLIEKDSSRPNNNSACLQQLLSDILKKLLDIDVVLQLLKGENMKNIVQRRKILCKKISQLSDKVKMVQINNIKHQIPKIGQLENGNKHNTVQNDKNKSVEVVKDEDTMRIYLGEDSWQIVKDTSEVGIRDNLLYCIICKTKVSGFENVVDHFDGKRHGKELNNCFKLFNNVFTVGDKGHCKLCNSEIPRTLRNMIEHLNGTRHKRKLQENCTDLKIHAVEGGELEILQNTMCNSRNSRQLSCNSLDPLVNIATAVHPETPARRDHIANAFGTQMSQLSPSAPTHPLPLQSALLSSKPVPLNVPFSSSVEINMASKPLHLNSTFATFLPCYGVFSSSIATRSSQFTEIPPMPMTAENICSSKQGAALNLLQESSNLTESDSSGANNNSACSEQLFNEILKMLIDIGVVLQLLKGESMKEKMRKILCKKISQFFDNVKEVQRTWGDIMQIINKEALTANKSVNNNNKKHQIPKIGLLENGNKHNTVQNDKNKSVEVVKDEDTMRSYLGEDSWQIVKDTSEVDIRDNLLYCIICKTKVSGFENVVNHFDGKRHGKELILLLRNIFSTGDKGHCKLCNTEIPHTLRNMFDHINGTRHKRKLQENCKELKKHAVEGAEIANSSSQILQNATHSSSNWRQLLTPARHDQLMAKLIANPPHLLPSKFVGFYCEPCNLFSYGKNVAKHANNSAHLVNMKNSETNRILFCRTCKIVLWGKVNLLVQHKMSAEHIGIQHLY